MGRPIRAMSALSPSRTRMRSRRPSRPVRQSSSTGTAAGYVPPCRRKTYRSLKRGRSAKRLARPSEAPDAAKPAVEGRAPAHATRERGPEGRKSAAKQRLSKRGKPGGEELPKTDAGKADAARDEPPKREPVQEDRPQNDTKYEGRPEGGNAPGEGKSEAAKIEAPKQTGNGDTPALRPDPVAPVTPAPQASPAAPTAISSGTPEPTAGMSGPSPQPAPPPAVTALVPPPPPVAPAGPPVPPISQ